MNPKTVIYGGDTKLNNTVINSALMESKYSWEYKKMKVKWNEHHSVVSDSLQSHGLYSPWNSPGQNTGVGSFPSPGDLPNPGIEPRPPALQVDSLRAEPQGKPENTGVGRLSLPQGIFPTQESNHGLLHCRWILYQLSYQGSLYKKRCVKFQGSAFKANWKQNQNRISMI